MAEINSNEALMVWIMNRLSEVFNEHAILKGGMVLRLLDCPRYTNDLDYVFIPYTSNKDILPLIIKVLNELNDTKINYSFHSTCLRIMVVYKDFKIQIESTVDKYCKAIGLSTSSLAKPNNQLPRIIQVMSFDVALAHKMAAWNERNLMRDLYDIYFIHSVLNEMPDEEVLRKRLGAISYTQGAQSKKQTKKMTIKEFLEKLTLAIEELTQKSLENELRDYFNPIEFPGLDKKIKIGIRSLIDKISQRYKERR